MTANEREAYFEENGITENFAIQIIRMLYDEYNDKNFSCLSDRRTTATCYIKRIYKQLFLCMTTASARYVEDKMEYELTYLKMFASGCKVYDVID